MEIKTIDPEKDITGRKARPLVPIYEGMPIYYLTEINSSGLFNGPFQSSFIRDEMNATLIDNSRPPLRTRL
jgi:hypothetical protein